MTEVPPPTRQLAALGGSLDDVLDRLRVPAYLIDGKGTIRWLNRAARDLVGDETGRPFLDVVVPRDRERATTAFEDKILGRHEATELRLDVMTRRGTTPVEISSVTVRGRSHRPVGVFGLAAPRRAEPPGSRRAPHLTPRQRETLMLLGEGASTEMIAERLGVARETARNHIRAVLRELGARTRLEAVLEAHARGML
jgi:DNA-binding CsgD family transcriptional regulator